MSGHRKVQDHSFALVVWRSPLDVPKHRLLAIGMWTLAIGAASFFQVTAGSSPFRPFVSQTPRLLSTQPLDITLGYILYILMPASSLALWPCRGID